VPVAQWIPILIGVSPFFWVASSAELTMLA